ncbi:MAG: hypothetical protein IPK64_17070 [bacterium]|nr:hypothetical protein [bacterium]
MTIRSVSLLVLALVLPLLFVAGCGDDETGACTWGSGYSGRCWEDFTAGQCDMMNGDLHLGATCADFGYGKAAGSPVVLSELSFTAAAAGSRLEWAELLNAGPRTIDLTGIALVLTDHDGVSTIVELSGQLHACGAIVVELAESAHAPAAADGVVALHAGADKTGDRRILDRVTLGKASASSRDVHAGLSGVASLDDIAPGTSWERVSWDADAWRISSRPDPGAAAPTLSCVDGGPHWVTITGTY